MITHISFEAAAQWEAVQRAWDHLAKDRVIERIWQRDHTVWKPKPHEIANRLGWLDIAARMWEEVGDLRGFADEVRRSGLTDAVLLGMGGSSLAPEVFSRSQRVADGFLRLHVLDSTDPGAVRSIQERIDLTRTLFIVATKSGGTVETLSGFKYFFNAVADAVGIKRTGERFIAITDPGSSLEQLASDHQFLRTFLNDPEIGGRYSALSYFGMVPAALIGMELERVLVSAIHEMEKSRAEVPRNSSAACGAVIATLAQLGRDKLTFLIPGPLASFGDWVEQLIAESTGKDSVGILPVVGETPGSPSEYGGDRAFVLIRHCEDESHLALAHELSEAGHPMIVMTYEDATDLGGLMFLWEMATAVAGHVLGIHPFDQPDVEAAKVRARAALADLRATGHLPRVDPSADDNGIAVFGAESGTVEEVISRFIGQTRFGDYIAIQAYLTPSPAHDEMLSRLRLGLRRRFHAATTVGYGPRFLHSTGQLHKGDRGNGLFVQITCDEANDLPIPDRAGAPESALSFGALKLAQAIGDGEALHAAGRRLLRVHLRDQDAGLAKLVSILAG
ncbi:MAG TPA: glucose-6-phosphate isomerase [bacterium]|nr:glucose-6-phosphate isomerase [bacterium]